MKGAFFFSWKAGKRTWELIHLKIRSQIQSMKLTLIFQKLIFNKHHIKAIRKQVNWKGKKKGMMHGTSFPES